MELTEFRKQRAVVEQEMYPYKIVRLDEVKQVEENVYSIGDTEVELSGYVQRKLDHAIGTTRKQLEMVRDCSGNKGQANFRNYLSVAKNMSEEKQVVLIANPESRVVTNVIVPQKRFIPTDSFFDFAEMFIDATNAKVERVEYSRNGFMEVGIYLQSAQTMIKELCEDEEFIANGMYLHWDGQSIELGSYFTRLVCSNGQVESINERERRIFSIAQEDVNKLLRLAAMPLVWQEAFNSFKEKALEAMEVNVSLRELGSVYSKLEKSDKILLPSEVAEKLVPYNDYVEHFKTQGVATRDREHLVKTDVNWWRFYNELTYFATHNTIMPADDIARTQIAIIAMHYLTKDHDIKNYIEYV